jgi:hypothetical protein
MDTHILRRVLVVCTERTSAKLYIAACSRAMREAATEESLRWLSRVTRAQRERADVLAGCGYRGSEISDADRPYHIGIDPSVHSTCCQPQPIQGCRDVYDVTKRGPMGPT